ncbi:MAG: hypothetical protein KI791_09890 [Cyclobacteriaceae bacterium]|nr:hypothetical protein [Cyclobacteriaceae bacterium SS2]
MKHLELLASEIFQRMDARAARQDKLNSLLAVIAVATVIMAGLSIVATSFIVFS